MSAVTWLVAGRTTLEDSIDQVGEVARMLLGRYSGIQGPASSRRCPCQQRDVHRSPRQPHCRLVDACAVESHGSLEARFKNEPVDASGMAVSVRVFPGQPEPCLHTGSAIYSARIVTV